MSEPPIPTLLDDLICIKNFIRDALKSGAYLYPLKGILYFLRRKPLRTPLVTRTVPTATIGLSVTTAMFFFTYVPQAAILAFTNGPLAPISAIFLVLTESSTITTFLARKFLLRDALIDTFDGTLIEKGCESVVSQGRQIKPGEANPMERLGNVAIRPFEEFNLQKALLRSLLCLPLNLIPVVGTPAYVILQGDRVGPVAHARYFQLKGWDFKKREEWVGRLRAAYLSFGVTSFVLEMVPFVSLVFTFTNTVGAALWAADLERVVQ
ncbi:hypothetical protein PHISCL_08228 [Aspergillus sclerotialis]|uniref:Outer spore wall protein RRT8 n=1 Tax=Aspergillus sclerotialis TaxID=2070753 RepID=A0A3A2Z8K6_9EURO|nr:hypothetical protein PHISCL_08228 [Aspergillus sclerotialis]